MALTTTALTAAITANQLIIPVGSTAVGFPPIGTVGANQPMQIDGEIMFITGVPSAGTVVVRGRGSEGTFAIAHDILAPVSTSSQGTDFRSPASPILSDNSPSVDLVVTIGQDQTITPPLVSTTYYILKASACAITLAAGLPTQAGVQMTFVSMTAFAHTIAYTPGFGGSTTATDLATFSSTLPATLQAEVSPTGGVFAISTLNVTIA